MTQNTPNQIAHTIQRLLQWLNNEYPDIDSLTIEYDGCGDSGQIEDIALFHSARSGAAASRQDALERELPVEIYGTQSQTYDKEAKQWIKSSPQPTTVERALDELGWDLAYSSHPGFEINEGGYGTIEARLNRCAGQPAVTLRHNERYTEITSTEQEFEF